jgi:hypothetical protein
VVYVVDVIVIVVPMCWSPKVQKDVGMPSFWELCVVEEVSALVVSLDSSGWYSNETVLVAAVLEATNASAGISASSENGSLVVPSMGASDSEGLPLCGW